MVACDDGLVEILHLPEGSSRLEVEATWVNEYCENGVRNGTWGLAMSAGGVVSGSNDHVVRVFIPGLGSRHWSQSTWLKEFALREESNELTETLTDAAHYIRTHPDEYDRKMAQTEDSVNKLALGSLEQERGLTLSEMSVGEREDCVSQCQEFTLTVMKELDILSSLASEPRNTRRAFRYLNGHTNNLPCVDTWDSYALSCDLDGSLALWCYDRRDPVCVRLNFQFDALWACARIARHSLYSCRGISAVNKFADRPEWSNNSTIDLIFKELIRFLSVEDLISLAQVRSHWVNVIEEELSRPRDESVFIALSNHQIFLLSQELEVLQTIEFPAGDFAFATITSPWKNRVFIGRKTASVVQISLYRLFNSNLVAMRADVLDDLPACYGISLCGDTLHGLTRKTLWSARV